MKQPNPHSAFDLFLEANLYRTIFPGFNPTLISALKDSLPVQDETQPWPSTWRVAYRKLGILINHGMSSFGEML
jgi:hypothetical protein